MGDFMDKAGKMAKYAAGKTGDAVEIGKCKAKIASRRSDIADLQKKIGMHFYEKYQITGTTDPEAEDYCKAIDDAEKSIEEMEDMVQNVKNGK